MPVAPRARHCARSFSTAVSAASMASRGLPSPGRAQLPVPGVLPGRLGRQGNGCSGGWEGQTGPAPRDSPAITCQPLGWHSLGSLLPSFIWAGHTYPKSSWDSSVGSPTLTPGPQLEAAIHCRFGWFNLHSRFLTSHSLVPAFLSWTSLGLRQAEENKEPTWSHPGLTLAHSGVPSTQQGRQKYPEQVRVLYQTDRG